MGARFEEKVSALLAAFVVAMVPFAFVMLLFFEPPVSARDIIMALAGAMIAAATQAVQHRFGSTPGSQRKDETINTLAQTAQQAGAALAPVAPSIPVAPGESVTVTGEEPRP